jgi:hypothetical protein
MNASPIDPMAIDVSMLPPGEQASFRHAKP